MEGSDHFLRLGLALAIGFIIGLERGWKERDEEEGARAAGLRTYSLIGLLGGVLGLLSISGDRILLATGFITTGAALAAFMWREGEREKDYSATSLIAALLTFVLGALAVLGDMTVAAGAGIAAAILLAHKAALHSWLNRLTWAELRSGFLLAAMTFIALPLLPDRTVDPWQLLNPHQLWLLTILIAAVSFVGYVAVKLAGPQRGLVLAATLGGLVSSTAVTVSVARMAKENGAVMKLLSGAILASGCVMVLRVLVIAGLLNPGLALSLAPVIIAAAAVSALIAALVIRSHHNGHETGTEELLLTNPFLLSEVLRFGALLAAVTIAVELAGRFLGDPGLLAVAALAGLADVDAITLSVARHPGVAQGAINAVLLALLVNTLAKTIYAWVAGGSRLGRLLLLQNAVTVAVAYGVWHLLTLGPT